VLTAHRAATERQRRGHDARSEVLEANGRSDDIYDRVDSADLVERHRLDRHAVDFRLGRREAPENAARELPRARFELGAGEQRVDRGVVALVLARGDVHDEAASADGSAARRAVFEPVAGETEPGDGGLHDRKRYAQIEQRRDGHVARDPARGVQQQDFSGSGTGGQGRLRRAHGLGEVVVIVIVRVVVRVPVGMVVIVIVIV
jgi:hypothetical protein